MTRRLALLVKKLRATDPDIVEIRQFGSSVYGPRLARDLELLILTQAKKEYVNELATHSQCAKDS